MTVAALPSKIDYLENGVTTNFAVPFRFLPGTITATRVLADGTVVALASGASFSTSGGTTDAGGTLTLIGASVAGAKLRIRRVTPRTQVANYVDNDSFPAESHEAALDRAMLVDQEQDDRINDTASRALLVPDGEVAAPLPSPSANVGKVLTVGPGGLLYWATMGGADAALRTDLADPDLGATLVANAVVGGDVNLGALPSGSTVAIDIGRTATQGDADGTSLIYSLANRVYAQGPYNYNIVRNGYFGTHIDTTAGITAQADGSHHYVWLGGAGVVTNAHVLTAHVRVDGPGDITNQAINFRAGTSTFGATGSVGTAIGFSVDLIGDTTRVANVIGFDVVNQQSTSSAVAFRSGMDGGTNRFQFLGAGTAASAFGGNVGVGMTTTPQYKLSVQESTNNWTADFSNIHGSEPYGIRVRYPNAHPNNNDHYFFRGSSSAGNMIDIWSTGSIVNATNSYGAISDIKLKRDIRDAGPQLDDIRAVRLRKYKLIADGDEARDHLGVIAQELELVSPGLVSDTADMEQVFEQAYERGGVGEPDLIPLIGMGKWIERRAGTVTKSVNYSVLNLKAVKALQELADIVDGQAAAIATLNDQAAVMEERLVQRTEALKSIIGDVTEDVEAGSGAPMAALGLVGRVQQLAGIVDGLTADVAALKGGEAA